MRRCARSTRKASTLFWPNCACAASTSRDEDQGEPHARKDQAGILGRDGPLLHHLQEQEDDAGEDGDQEVRPGRSQARPVQGNQAQVVASPDAAPAAPANGDWEAKESPPFGGLFILSA